MSDNILTHISDNIEHFSKNQKKIARFIIENTDEAAFMTAAQIAHNVECSESTVVRFAMALGFEGYPEFTRELSNVIKNRLNSVQKLDILHTNMTPSKIVEYVMRGDSDKISETIATLDSIAFEQATDMILSANKVYIVAVRTAVGIADFLAFYLRLIVKNVELVTTNSSTEIFERLINVGVDDVVIGISFPRYSIRTLKAMEYANERNAKIISITDSIHSPMNLYSSCNLFARTDMASVVDSLVAPLSLINALIVALCVKNSKRVVNVLERLNDAWEDYDINSKDEINYLSDELMKDLKGLE